MQDSKNTARETKLLAAADVAGMIGVEESTVYRWCSEGKLPCLKIGNHWRIRLLRANFLELRKTEVPTSENFPTTRLGE
jgi:excisionase family DNA binding protein